MKKSCHISKGLEKIQEWGGEGGLKLIKSLIPVLTPPSFYKGRSRSGSTGVCRAHIMEKKKKRPVKVSIPWRK